MADDNDLDAYTIATQDLGRLGTELKTILRTILSETAVVVHSLEPRVKSKFSCDNKIQTHPEQFKTYRDLHDLLGLRIITLFESDLDAAADVIESVIDIDPGRSSDKGERYKPDQFGYRSRHFVGQLASNRLNLPENRSFEECVVEIQLRSILQHAWAEIEHDLGYKPQRPLSDKLRRQFSRLAAVMEMADEQFSDLRRQLEATEAQALTTAEQGTVRLEAQNLDIVSLGAFIKTNTQLRLLDSRVAATLGRSVLPVGRDSRPFTGYILDLCTAVGWLGTSELSAAIGKYGDAIVKDAAGMASDIMPVADPNSRGLRPGFSLALLTRHATERLSQ